MVGDERRGVIYMGGILVRRLGDVWMVVYASGVLD